MDIFVNDITLSFLGWFLASLVSFLLGLLLGYLLWYKYRNQVARLEADLKKEHDRFVEVETKFASLKYQHDELTKDKKALQDALNRCEGDKVIIQGMLNEMKEKESGGDGGAVSVAGPGVMSRSPETSAVASGLSDASPDDLKIIEGIGPKIEQILNDAGIKTWADLSTTDIDHLQKLLTEAGSRYRLANPETWPKQAALAAAGKWEELQSYQDVLQGGRDANK